MAGLVTRPSARFYGCNVTFESIEAVLGSHHLVSVRLKSGNDFAEA
jgi:hypothetical protein